jgi:hypothetical protein
MKRKRFVCLSYPLLGDGNSRLREFWTSSQPFLRLQSRSAHHLHVASDRSATALIRLTKIKEGKGLSSRSQIHEIPSLRRRWDYWPTMWRARRVLQHLLPPHRGRSYIRGYRRTLQLRIHGFLWLSPLSLCGLHRRQRSWVFNTQDQERSARWHSARPPEPLVCRTPISACLFYISANSILRAWIDPDVARRAGSRLPSNG